MLDPSLIARVSDLYERAGSKNILTCTDFLTPSEVALLMQKLPKGEIQIASFGGYSDAERQKIFFLPEYLDPEDETVFDSVSAIKCSASFSSLTHRDYLGALLSLGIKRSCVGDILVFDQEAILIVDTKLVPFILENLTHIGHGGVSCKQITLSEITPPIQKYQEIERTVASLRADSIFAAAFNISREKAAELIRNELCTVDWIPIQSPSDSIAENAVLSARGLGRAKLAKVGGTSKKGRIFISVHIYE
ncbi:MAG: hypothetical protein E7471_01955 [Ruminococcaceae bacterium]|nr:hypothetical protein [Oscillospiraceae bacterium]